MTERTILFVAYQFPPCGGAGVQRAVQLCKYFPSNGISPVVLTTSKESYLQEKRRMDESLSEFLPKDITRIEIDNPFPYRLKRFLLKSKLFSLFWYVFYPVFWEQEFWWAVKAGLKLRKLFKGVKTDIVLTTSGPFSSILIGLLSKQLYRKKWICDLRDPFTDAYAWNFPSLIHRNIMRRLEFYSIKRADRVVVTSEATRARYIEVGIPAEKISVITNGYS